MDEQENRSFRWHVILCPTCGSTVGRVSAAQLRVCTAAGGEAAIEFSCHGKLAGEKPCRQRSILGHDLDVPVRPDAVIVAHRGFSELRRAKEAIRAKL